MRKRILLILLIIFIISILIIGWSFVFNNEKHRKNNLSISYSDVNNRYNNMLANTTTHVVQIRNKIYYYCTFGGDPLNYGLYEIQSGSTKRLFWDGLTFYPKGFNLDCVYKDKILKQAYSNTFFNTETHRFEDDSESIKWTEDYSNYVSFIKDDILYSVSEYELVQYNDENEKFYALANVDDMEMKNFHLNDMQNFYLTEDRVIYQTSIDGVTFIYCYDFNLKSIIYKCSLADIPGSENGVCCLFANNSEVFFVSHNTLFRLNPYENMHESLFTCDKQFCVNFFENNLVLGVGRGSNKQGVYIIDLEKPNKECRICEIPVDGIYILDNQYVYFTDEDYHLYRILLNGNSLEIVFDK